MVAVVPSVTLVSLVLFWLTAIGDRAQHINMFFDTSVLSAGVIAGLALIGGTARTLLVVAEKVGKLLRNEEERAVTVDGFDTRPPPRLVVSLWQHQDPRVGLPAIIWCLGNADGSYYVDWDRATFLANCETGGDVHLVMMQMYARLILAARGTYREVSKEEADRIAIAAYPENRLGRTLQ